MHRQTRDTSEEVTLSGYPDLTTEGENMINSSSDLKDQPVVSHEV
jgi:hypothetical protein